MKYSIDTNYLIGLLNPKDRLNDASKEIVRKNNSDILVVLNFVLQEYGLKYSDDFDGRVEKIIDAIFDQSNNKRETEDILKRLEELKKAGHPAAIFYPIIFEANAKLLLDGDRIAIVQNLSKTKINLIANISREVKTRVESQVIDSPIKQDSGFQKVYNQFLKASSEWVADSFKDASDQRIFCEAAAYSKYFSSGLVLFTNDKEFRNSAKTAIEELGMYGLADFKVLEK